MCRQNISSQFSLVSAKDNTQQIVVLLHRTNYQTDLRATYAHICKLFLSYLCFPAKWFLSLRPNSGAPRKIHMRPPALLIVEVSASSTIEQDSSMARISKNSPTTSSWDGHFHSYLKIMATNLTMGRWSTQPKLVKNQCLGQFTTLNLNIQWAPHSRYSWAMGKSPFYTSSWAPGTWWAHWPRVNAVMARKVASTGDLKISPCSWMQLQCCWGKLTYFQWICCGRLMMHILR